MVDKSHRRRRGEGSSGTIFRDRPFLSYKYRVVGATEEGS